MKTKITRLDLIEAIVKATQIFSAPRWIRDTVTVMIVSASRATQIRIKVR
jgi:hypothetical protein